MSLALAFVLSFSAQASGGKDPAALLRTLYDDLRKASQAAADARDKARKSARDAFDREIGAATLRAPKSAWDLVRDHFDRLSEGDRFSLKNDRAERDLWVSACRTALLRQLALSKEVKGTDAEMATTSQLFNDAFSTVGELRTKFTAEGTDDLRGAALEGVGMTFRLLIRRARVPAIDAKAAYASQLSKIDQKFPVDGDGGKVNGRINAVLKEAAKSALDRSLSGAAKP